MLDDTGTRNLEANGIRFAYQEHGDVTGDPIVLIRGLGTQMIEWSPQLLGTLTGGGLRVIIFDNRDVGLSSKLESNYGLSDMAGDVVGVMRALALDRFHVFGISLGGMIAQLVAQQNADMVRCLFSVMSSSGNPDLPQPTPEIRERLLINAGGDRAGNIALDAENRVIFGSPGFPETERQRREMAARVYDRCYFPEGVARQMRAAIADGSRTERLGKIRCRALVIHGADDSLILPACGADTARCIPSAQFQLVPGMGHNIPDTLAADIGRRVLRFISESSRVDGD